LWRYASPRQNPWPVPDFPLIQSWAPIATAAFL
jgi:hypothetical protein